MSNSLFFPFISFLSFSAFLSSVLLLLASFSSSFPSFTLCLHLSANQNVPFHQLSPQSQKVMERLKELEQEVSGGATVAVALILNNKLYIANVGKLWFLYEL